MKAVILASGEGSNAENIVSFFKDKKEYVEVVGIISDKAGSGVLERAKVGTFQQPSLKRTQGKGQFMKKKSTTK